jgi:glycosyltransferase involved in cell wall biosynthesis
MKPLVTIITPTTGSDQLYDALASVEKQTYENIEHIIVVDGLEYVKKANSIIEGSKAKVIYLPHNTGADNYNGHRIYAAVSFLMNGDYVCFLDQDNWFEANHVESLMDVIQSGMQWSYSLRKIVDQSGKYICNDDCESLGNWLSVLDDRFVDVNCYMIPKMAAISFAPYWYRRARHPQEQPEVDRMLSLFMMNTFTRSGTNGEYTVNYRVASRADSVQDLFFIKGNEVMKNKMNGVYPWRKKI